MPTQKAHPYNNLSLTPTLAHMLALRHREYCSIGTTHTLKIRKHKNVGGTGAFSVIPSSIGDSFSKKSHVQSDSIL